MAAKSHPKGPWESQSLMIVSFKELDGVASLITDPPTTSKISF